MCYFPLSYFSVSSSSLTFIYFMFSVFFHGFSLILSFPASLFLLLCWVTSALQSPYPIFSLLLSSIPFSFCLFTPLLSFVLFIFHFSFFFVYVSLNSLHYSHLFISFPSPLLCCSASLVCLFIYLPFPLFSFPPPQVSYIPSPSSSISAPIHSSSPFTCFHLLFSSSSPFPATLPSTLFPLPSPLLFSPLLFSFLSLLCSLFLCPLFCPILTYLCSFFSLFPFPPLFLSPLLLCPLSFQFLLIYAVFFIYLCLNKASTLSSYLLTSLLPTLPVLPSLLISYFSSLSKFSLCI